MTYGFLIQLVFYRKNVVYWCLLRHFLVVHPLLKKPWIRPRSLCRKDGSKPVAMRMMWKRFPARHITGHNKFSSMKFRKVILKGRHIRHNSLISSPQTSQELFKYSDSRALEPISKYELQNNELRSSILQRLRSSKVCRILGHSTQVVSIEHCWVWTWRPKVIGSIGKNCKTTK